MQYLPYGESGYGEGVRRRAKRQVRKKRGGLQLGGEMENVMQSYMGGMRIAGGTECGGESGGLYRIRRTRKDTPKAISRGSILKSYDKFYANLKKRGYTENEILKMWDLEEVNPDFVDLRKISNTKRYRGLKPLPRKKGNKWTDYIRKHQKEKKATQTQTEFISKLAAQYRKENAKGQGVRKRRQVKGRKPRM